MIEAPTFEGYKCIGYTRPKKGQYYLTQQIDSKDILLEAGYEWEVYKSLVYEKIKRYTFEETGEVRQLFSGEWYITDNDHIGRWTESGQTYTTHRALRKIKEE